MQIKCFNKCTSVNSPVFLKVDRCPEASLADFAFVISDTGVDLVVDCQRIFARKLFSAEFTLKGLLVTVDRGEVVAQIRILAKVPAALLTLEWFFSFKQIKRKLD